jgi:putative membrane protein
MPKSHKLIYGIYVIVWIIMAINPKYPQDWLLENVLVFFIFPFIIWMDKKHHYSLLSIVLFLLFASLHSLGSHYTYAEMEHFDIITQFFGFERNHFDRLVHFLFGLLLFRILFEMITPGIATVKTALLFTFTMIVSISALIFHPGLGTAFLGTQGDVWDAQQDTLVATIGALINMAFYKNYKHLLLEKRLSKPLD